VRWERQRGQNAEEMAAACHTVEDADPERRMMMGPIAGVVGVDMLVAFIVVGVRVLVDLDPPCSGDRPSPDADEQETDEELRPPRPGLNVDEAPQRQSDPADDGNADSVTETLEDSGSCRAGRILNSRRSECREVIHT
jgi:hypothetical protein